MAEGASAAYTMFEPYTLSEKLCVGNQGGGSSSISISNYASGYYFYYLLVTSGSTKGGYIRNTGSSYAETSFDQIGSVPSSQNVTLAVANTYPFKDLSFNAASGSGYEDTYVYWIMGREYPPNGVMPSASFGTLAV